MEENAKPPRAQARKAVTRPRIITAGGLSPQTNGIQIATGLADIIGPSMKG